MIYNFNVCNFFLDQITSDSLENHRKSSIVPISSILRLCHFCCAISEYMLNSHTYCHYI